MTSFQLSSPIWDNIIEYTWIYTPTADWCPLAGSDVSGTYKYTLGVNNCSGSNTVCVGK